MSGCLLLIAAESMVHFTPVNGAPSLELIQRLSLLPRYVMLGNHRDAWVYGAADPNSGTAALLEVSHPETDLTQKALGQ